MVQLSLRERGATLPLSHAQHALLAEDPHFHKLLSAGIIRLRSIGDQWGIEPTKYVGRATLRQGIIDIQPRHSTLFYEISTLATAFAIRRVAETAPGFSTLGAAPILHAVVQQWNTAVSEGLPMAYSYATVKGSSIRGRLMISDTISTFLSRGIRHKAISREKRHHLDRRVASVALAGLEFVSLHPSLDRSTRELLNRLVDCIDDDAYRVSISQALELCSELQDAYKDWPVLCRALSLTEALLLGENVVWNYQIDDEEGQSRFCDMDRLWELAVFSMVKSSSMDLDVEAMFHPFAGSNYLLLENGIRTIDPDILLSAATSDVRLIVDAKYSITSVSNNTDIYQMLAYARRINARGAVLVYLAENAWVENIGEEDSRQFMAIGLSIHDVGRSAGKGLAPIIRSTFLDSNGERQLALHIDTA